MPTYQVECEHDGNLEIFFVEAEDLHDATCEAERISEDWIRDVEWGDAGATVAVRYTIVSEVGAELLSGDATVVIEPAAHYAAQQAEEED